MIVADTNILAYLQIPGDQSRAAELLRARDADWHAPHLWQSEFCNLLLGYVRQGRYDAAGCVHLLCRARSAVTGHDVDHSRVLMLGERHRCTAYDLAFVVLAQELGVPLVTQDRDLLREFPDIAVPLA